MPFRRVKGPVRKAITPGQKKTKYSWIFRHYKGPSNMRKKFVDSKGRPTPHALQAKRWGLAIPRTQADRGRILRLGKRLQSQVKRKETARKKTSFYSSRK